MIGAQPISLAKHFAAPTLLTSMSDGSSGSSSLGSSSKDSSDTVHSSYSNPSPPSSAVEPDRGANPSQEAEVGVLAEEIPRAENENQKDQGSTSTARLVADLSWFSETLRGVRSSVPPGSEQARDLTRLLGHLDWTVEGLARDKCIATYLDGLRFTMYSLVFLYMKFRLPFSNF